MLAYLVNQPQLIKEGVSTVGNLLSVTPDYSCVATFLKLYYSSMVRFEWDEAKAKTNERKHGCVLKMPCLFLLIPTRWSIKIA